MDPLFCYFCGQQTVNFCEGCGYAICAECDNEPDVDGAHDPQAHLDTDEEGYAE